MLVGLTGLLHCSSLRSVLTNHKQGGVSFIVCCTGGQQEAHEAYQTAYTAIFVEGHNVHRHTRSRIKSGRRKWEVLEMWPMTVSGHVHQEHI